MQACKSARLPGQARAKSYAPPADGASQSVRVTKAKGGGTPSVNGGRVHAHQPTPQRTRPPQTLL
eukprot:15594671-Heterocapsa_arctica.AAC.1